MSKSFIDMMLVDGKRFYRFTDTDTVEIHLQGKTVFTIDASGWAYNKKGHQIGKFRLSDDETWEYVDFLDEEIPNTIHPTNFYSLLKAEAKIFERVLSKYINK